MVADAQARTKHEDRRLADKRGAREFRGSWSGYERDMLFHNPDGLAPRFYQSAYVYGVDFDDDGRSAVAWDFDGDGDLDLLMNSLQGIHLVENTWDNGHFARVRLQATKSEPLALGAVVVLTSGGVTQRDYVKFTDGYVAQVPLDLHFGLAAASKVDSIEVTWPSGARETWKDLPINRILCLKEGATEAATLEVARWAEEFRPRSKSSCSLAIVSQLVGGGSGPVARAGTPAVINFWGPTCGPCKEELPLLEKIATDAGNAVQFAGVTVDTSDPAAIQDVIKGFGLSYPQFLGNEPLLRSFFGDSGQAIVPSTFVFDQKGRLRRLYRRPITGGELSALLDSFRDEDSSANQLEYLAANLLRAGETEKALAVLDRVVTMDSPGWTAWHQRGLALVALGRSGEAIECFEKAIALDPTNPDAHYNLAVALHASGKAAESIPHYLAAYPGRKDQYDYLVLYGNAAAEAMKPDLARDLFEQAIVREPTNPRAHTSKGKLLMFLGRSDEAAKCFEIALSLDPKFGEAQKFLRELKLGPKR